MKVLYVFISSQRLINNCYTRIINIMKNINLDSFINVIGGYSNNTYLPN